MFIIDANYFYSNTFSSYGIFNGYNAFKGFERPEDYIKFLDHARAGTKFFINFKDIEVEDKYYQRIEINMSEQLLDKLEKIYNWINFFLKLIFIFLALIFS